MRTNWILMVVLGAFFFVAATVYTLWELFFDPYVRTLDAPSGVEWVGTVGIYLSAILAFFIAFYLRITAKSVGGELPEDKLDSEIDDGDPEMGHFSPWSWWPFLLSFGLGLMFLGLAVGPWVAIIGGPIAFISVLGWVFEYYRGNFAR